ncbi:hypothetical protein C8R44DRAFT_760544 [Mycena epipterygia]|nr:hypothetical protein C8R44DRAFT_760544 [Mycena epipterygia]
MNRGPASVYVLFLPTLSICDHSFAGFGSASNTTCLTCSVESGMAALQIRGFRISGTSYFTGRVLATRRAMLLTWLQS